MAKAARDWDDRPIMYPFLTDTLQDASKVRAEVFEPLRMLLDSHADPRVRARVRDSLETLVTARKHFKVDQETVAECNLLLARADVAALPKDKRGQMQEHLLQVFNNKRLPAGVSQLSCRRWAAHVHVGGRPLWGRVRNTLEEAVADRKELVAVKKKGLRELETFLLEIRGAGQS